ncbi:MAG: prolyl oligopeptidase family serine peptidase [Candidatus Eremiobacterota bacterium]
MRFKIIILLVLAICIISPVIGKLDYPEAITVDVSDDYFGTKVADPYRWMENPDSPETIAWVKAQNELSEKYLNTPEREKIKERAAELWNPNKKNNEIKEKTDSLPNSLYPHYSPDKKFAAYSTSNGSDIREIKIRNISTGKDYNEVLRWSKGFGIAWKHDNSGFYYPRYPEPGTVPKEDERKYQRVYWHKVGTSQAEDILIYERPDDKELSFFPRITEDGTYLILYVRRGMDSKKGIYYRPMDSNGDFIKLLDIYDSSYDFIDNTGSVFYLKTDLNAPGGRVIAIDVNNPGKENWKEIIPQEDGVICFYTMVNNCFVIEYMHNVSDKIKIFDLNGKFIDEINPPVPGSIGTLSGERNGSELYYTFSSFLYPETTFKYSFKEKKSEVFKKTEVPFDPSIYETKQVFYKSKDGTKIPMFITYKKGISLDGNNPVLLYGYGGFGICDNIFFSTWNIIWCEHGGIYAVPAVRGGGEFGKEWHEAGKGKNKQNSFDDFISAAEWLIENKYTRPSLLAIYGFSNGGLLTASCMVQRPELFGSVVCHGGIYDMLRYKKFTAGYKWTSEYGDPLNSFDEFKTIYAYSPLHNVKPNVYYPPTLVITGDYDDRALPFHSEKFVATLQAKNVSNNPILFKSEQNTGHETSNTSQIDLYTFLFKTFHMKW